MRWSIKPVPDVTKQTQLAASLNIDERLAGLLVQRGVDTFAKAKSFFRPSLKELHDPFLMKDMQAAVERLHKAIVNEERILVYGDYDVDGTTSVALISSYLKTFHDKISTYIPDRYKEGYGVSYTGIDFAVDNDFTLIIALDCGIKAIDKVAYARERDVDFIICDHHRPGNKLPAAVAVLDPKRKDCSYPYDELCGCGVGFKLLQAYTVFNNWSFDILIPYLDLVATAIGADIVPMTGENRILAYHGLKVINTAPRPGFLAIIKLMKKEVLTITDVVFTIAPRINAAGRMKHGEHAVALLTASDEETAIKYAQEIETYNSDRKETDRDITAQALEIIKQEELKNDTAVYSTVVFNPEWHKGVIGIVASRLIEQYYRPTLVFTQNGDYITASARSVKGFDIYHALEQCSEFIEQYGGHKYAAGLTMKPENLAGFKKRFEEVVCATISNRSMAEELHIDMELSLDTISPKFYRILMQMAPFGPLNMTPVFMSRKVMDKGYGKCVGQEEKHLKLAVAHKAPKQHYIDAIGFNLGDKCDLTTGKKLFNIAYSLDINEWNGVKKLQLRLRDIES